MYFTSKELAKNLNIELSWMFKVFSKCGLKKMPRYSVQQLELVARSLKSEQYKTQLLREKLTLLINEGVKNV